MNDILTDLKVYATRCRLEADSHERDADAALDQGVSRLEQAGGADRSALDWIEADARTQADHHRTQASRKRDRADAADRGAFLARHPEELGDMHFAMDPSTMELYHRAGGVGLVTDR